MLTSTCSTTVAARQRSHFLDVNEAVKALVSVELVAVPVAVVPLGMSACTLYPATTCTRLRRGAAARSPPRTGPHPRTGGTYMNYDEMNNITINNIQLSKYHMAYGYRITFKFILNTTKTVNISFVRLFVTTKIYVLFI